MKEVVEHHLSTLTIARAIKHHVFRPREAMVIERRDWGNFFARRRAGRLGLREYFFKGRMVSGALVPDWADLTNMYDIVRERRPQVVVEIGGGCSTIVIAHALAENVKEGGTEGRIYSFDGSKFWQEELVARFPDHLRNHVEFVVGHEEAREIFGTQVRICANAENDAPPPNFLYVDGLDVVPDIKVGAEAIELEKAAPADFFVLVDGRAPTVGFLKHHLARNYEVRTHPLFHWTTFTPLLSNQP